MRASAPGRALESGVTTGCTRRTGPLQSPAMAPSSSRTRECWSRGTGMFEC